MTTSLKSISVQCNSCNLPKMAGKANKRLRVVEQFEVHLVTGIVPKQSNQGQFHAKHNLILKTSIVWHAANNNNNKLDFPPFIHITYINQYLNRDKGTGFVPGITKKLKFTKAIIPV